jgi:hypothetical protein
MKQIHQLRQLVKYVNPAFSHLFLHNAGLRGDAVVILVPLVTSTRTTRYRDELRDNL